MAAAAAAAAATTDGKAGAMELWVVW